MNYALCLLISALITGCASYPTKAKLETKLQSWIGLPADKVVASWGQPDEMQTSYNGNRLMIYKSDYRVADDERLIPSYSQLKCTIAIELDKSNTIISYSKRGNNCTSR